MFSARQEKGESVASRGSCIDEIQTELREAARNVCKPEEIHGAVGLINHLGKACFVQGLCNEWIQTIVHSRGTRSKKHKCRRVKQDKYDRSEHCQLN